MSQPFKIGGALPLQKQISPEAMDSKAKAVSKMYEEYFLQQMVKAMRKTVVPADKPSFADNLYHEQLDQQYVKAWGDRGGVGLANIIYNQLKERYLNPAVVQPPHGPIPIHKDVRFKIEKPKNSGPKDLTMLYEWNENTPVRDVTSPYDSRVLQAFRTQDVGSTDERQTIKLAHDNGLVSTLSYVGWARDFQPDEQIAAGEKIGLVSPGARGLTWQLGERS